MHHLKFERSLPSKLATPTDLGEKARQDIASAVNPLIADAFALFVKTKNYHWHLFGSHYRDYHLLFDAQAHQLFDMIDVLAERLRKLGATTIRSIEHISQLQSVKDDNSDFVEAKHMLQNLMEENKQYVARLRAAHEVASKYHDVATTSVLENFIDEAEHRTWFLYETQAE